MVLKYREISSYSYLSYIWLQRLPGRVQGEAIPFTAPAEEKVLMQNQAWEKT